MLAGECRYLPATLAPRIEILLRVCTRTKTAWQALLVCVEGVEKGRVLGEREKGRGIGGGGVCPFRAFLPFLPLPFYTLVTKASRLRNMRSKRK